MGVAYLAEQEELGRKVVLKILHLNLANDPEGKARFIREAQLLGSLQHSHLVQVFSAGIYADEFPYIALEYLEGKTLEDTIRTAAPLDWKRACRIAIQACDAMTYCHAAGVIHRDLKPANIILLQNTQSDFVKLIDFGLAKALDGSKNTLTATGLVVGSPHYMSPEMCAGQKPDSRCDVYSLACVLYEMIAGRPPFVSESPFELFSAHQTEQPVEPSKHVPGATIPAALDATLLKALEKKAESRFANMQEFADNLNAVLSDRELSFDLKELSVYRKPKKSASRLRIGAIVAVTLTMILFGVAFSMHVTGSRNKSIASADDATTKELNNIENSLEQLHKAKARGDRKRVSEQASRVIRLLVHELSSNRDQKSNFKRELALLDRLKNYGPELYSTDNFRNVRNIAKPHMLDSEDGISADTYHNKAEFQIFEGNVFLGLKQVDYAIESWAMAALSFSCAKESENAAMIIQQSDALLETGRDKAFLRLWVDIGKASTYAFQDDKSKFLNYASDLKERISKLQDPPNQTRCYSHLGWLARICGENKLAKLCFEEAIKLKVTDPIWFTNECTVGLAEILEEQGKYSEALELQTQIAQRFNMTGLISRHTKAVAAIDRLRERIAKEAN